MAEVEAAGERAGGARDMRALFCAGRTSHVLSKDEAKRGEATMPDGPAIFETTPWMLSRLADAEREVENDMKDRP